jgi:AcrR family transcriptional regulator
MSSIRSSSPGSARSVLLSAAKQVLRTRGYGGLSTREVAIAAGMPLSQIHYHFGSRVGLVVALFEDLTAQLQHRQQTMFGDPSLSLSQRWERACDHLDEDFASGYVRVFAELTNAALSDAQIGEVLRAAHRGWIALIESTVERHLADGGRIGPFTAREIAAQVSAMFFGNATLVLLGLEDDRTRIRAVLRRAGDLIRVLETSTHRGDDHEGEATRRRRRR